MLIDLECKIRVPTSQKFMKFRLVRPVRSKFLRTCTSPIFVCPRTHQLISIHEAQKIFGPYHVADSSHYAFNNCVFADGSRRRRSSSDYDSGHDGPAWQ